MPDHPRIQLDLEKLLADKINFYMIYAHNSEFVTFSQLEFSLRINNSLVPQMKDSTPSI